MNKKGFIMGALIDMLSYFLIILILLVFVFFFRGSASDAEQIAQINEDVYYSNLLNGYLNSKVLVDDVEMSVSDVVSLTSGQGFFDQLIRSIPFSSLFYDDPYFTALRSNEIKFFVKPDSKQTFAINIKSGSTYYYKNLILENEVIKKSIFVPSTNERGFVIVELVYGDVSSSVLEIIKGDKDAFLKKNDYNSYLVNRNSENKLTFSELTKIYDSLRSQTRSNDPSIKEEYSGEYEFIDNWLNQDYDYMLDEMPETYLRAIFKANEEFNPSFNKDASGNILVSDNADLNSIKIYFKNYMDNPGIFLPESYSGLDFNNLNLIYNKLIFKSLVLEFYENYVRENLGMGVFGENTYRAVACGYFGNDYGVCSDG